MNLPSEFKLNLTPTPDEENHVSLTLHVTNAPDYPEVRENRSLEG